MRIESLHVGLRVKHPQYGVGTVKSIGEHTAEIRFDEGMKTVAPDTSGLQPAEAQATITGLDQPLGVFVAETAKTPSGWSNPVMVACASAGCRPLVSGDHY